MVAGSLVVVVAGTVDAMRVVVVRGTAVVARRAVLVGARDVVVPSANVATVVALSAVELVEPIDVAVGDVVVDLSTPPATVTFCAGRPCVSSTRRPPSASSANPYSNALTR